MDRRTVILSGAATAALLSRPARAQGQDQELRLLTGWDDRSEVVIQVVDPLMAALVAGAGQGTSVRRFGPETIPPFEQLDPVGRGVFDLLFTNGAYHYNQSAVAMAVEAFDVTPQTLRESGL